MAPVISERLAAAHAARRKRVHIENLESTRAALLSCRRVILRRLTAMALTMFDGERERDLVARLVATQAGIRAVDEALDDERALEPS